jgi:hypothetical protein
MEYVQNYKHFILTPSLLVIKIDIVFPRDIFNSTCDRLARSDILSYVTGEQNEISRYT